MKVMISQPMNGKTDEEILSTKSKAESFINENGHELVNTLFMEEWYNETDVSNEDITNRALYFLGHSLVMMSTCDAVYFCKGWENARGCKIEHDAAVSYGLTVIYEN